MSEQKVPGELIPISQVEQKVYNRQRLSYEELASLLKQADSLIQKQATHIQQLKEENNKLKGVRGPGSVKKMLTKAGLIAPTEKAIVWKCKCGAYSEGNAPCWSCKAERQ